jgi:hypothetical protein
MQSIPLLHEYRHHLVQDLGRMPREKAQQERQLVQGLQQCQRRTCFGILSVVTRICR